MSVLEVCCGNLPSVDAAVEGGAPRIDLCSHLELDGLTPAWKDLRTVRARYPGLLVHVLIRSRAGDFHYTTEEVQAMADEIRTAVSLGADGIVCGALDSQGNVDLTALRIWMDAAGDVPVTFHRAFDVCRDPSAALEDIIGLGCRRILTSGQAPTALAGAVLIARLRQQAAGRILLLPGGGIGPDNARAVLEKTGCSELHASASEKSPDGTRVTSGRKVAAILAAML